MVLRAMSLQVDNRLIIMFQIFTIVLIFALKVDTNMHLARLSKMIDAILTP